MPHLSRLRAIVALFVFLALAAPARAGNAARTPWTSGKVAGSPDPPEPFQTRRLYPRLAFDSPVDIAFAPSLHRALVVCQHGKLYSFADRPGVDHADLLLDLQTVHGLDKVPDCAGAGDSFTLALDPQFADNHFIYVTYVLAYKTRVRNHANGTRVSRFTVTASDPPRIDPASERILLTWLEGGHNGSCLRFGPDGDLYISSGDGGDPNPPDPFGTGQDISDLLSSILRIDVRHSAAAAPYAIPPDNPFVKTPGARGEVYAYGLRNPWRFSFDPDTGALWVGDVGWELFESVHCVEPGGNYGWSIVEGPNSVHPFGKRGPTPIIAPLVALPHTEAASLTGGVVYRGSKLPELRGQYLFGDWQTQRLWAARLKGPRQRSLEPYREIAQTDQKIVSFGVTPAGEPIIVDHGGGGLWEIAPNDAKSRPEDFPHKLSQTGLFQSVAEQTPAPGVLPFQVNAPQWCDGAVARRWVAVPGRENVGWGKGAWGDDKPAWPKDSVLVRTLSLPPGAAAPVRATAATTAPARPAPVPVETQLLHFDGKQWRAYSYAWNEAGTDAELVDGAGGARPFTVPGGARVNWQFASRAQCLTCHNVWSNYALAFNDAQLDRAGGAGSAGGASSPGGAGVNQVRYFREIGLLPKPMPVDPGPQAQGEPAEPDDRSTLVDPYDPSGNLYERARSYLAANCSPCHRFGAGGSALFDVRKELPIDKTHLIDVRPSLGDFGIADGRLIAGGDPPRSVLLYRMSKLGAERMPHVGSQVVDEKGVELIRQWIASLTPAPGALSPVAAAARSQADAALAALRSPAATGPDADAAIDRLLSTTGGALALLCDLDSGRLTATNARRAIDRGLASRQPLSRDLFRRFDPTERQADRLGPTIDTRKLLAISGDPSRGRRIFFESAGGLCGRCHRIAGQGTDFGPDLSHIGARYNKADLLDNILFPSKTIAQGFTSYLVRTRDGDVVTGLLVSRDEHEIVIKDATLTLTRIPAAQIAKATALPTSAMPEGLLNDLSAQEAADLLVFVEERK